MKTDYIEGLRKNIGALLTEKADAGKAILDTCRTMTSPNPIPLG